MNLGLMGGLISVIDTTVRQNLTLVVSILMLRSLAIMKQRATKQSNKHIRAAKLTSSPPRCQT